MPNPRAPARGFRQGPASGAKLAGPPGARAGGKDSPPALRPAPQQSRRHAGQSAHRPDCGAGYVSIAWPSDLLLDAQGRFAGYIMPLVAGVEPLIKYCVPKLRRQGRPLFNYFYLVTAAFNVASAVRAPHERGYVIGDVNESNILAA